MRIQNLAFIFSFLFAAQAFGQSGEDATVSSNDDTRVIGAGLQRLEANGFTAEALLEQDVSGQDGQPIGEVINFEISDDNLIQRVLINSDGFLGIDETVIAVPYDAIDLTEDEDGIRAKIEEDDTDAYSIFSPNDKSTASAGSYRVSSLIGDDVLLKGGDEFGYLSDLAFDRNGRLQAVIVQPDITIDAEGYYAFPFERSNVSGTSFDPSASSYSVSLDREAVLKNQAFDYNAFSENSILSSSATQTSETSSQ
ncbi:MAG: PRC-barrel domain-containing protein [Pseudomonadota bacterium]|nr:PRC-barrel domain-containing protein [Pseudomonadota bacterium]